MRNAADRYRSPPNSRSPPSSSSPHTAIAAAELSRSSPLPSELQVPVGDPVGRQMGQETIGAAPGRVQQRRVSGVAVVERESVDPPRLPPGPAGVVRVALLGLPAQRLARHRIPV